MANKRRGMAKAPTLKRVRIPQAKSQGLMPTSHHGLGNIISGIPTGRILTDHKNQRHLRVIVGRQSLPGLAGTRRSLKLRLFMPSPKSVSLLTYPRLGLKTFATNPTNFHGLFFVLIRDRGGKKMKRHG